MRRDAPDTIIITPAMLKAGVDAFRLYEPGDDYEMIVDWIYRGMESARIKEARLNSNYPPLTSFSSAQSGGERGQGRPMRKQASSEDGADRHDIGAKAASR